MNTLAPRPNVAKGMIMPVDITEKLSDRDDIIMSSEPVRLDALNFDTSEWGGYQRSVSEKAVNRIVHKFNPAMFEPITVSMRDDGSLWVIDGHHRSVAASRMGRTHIPGRIIYGLDRVGEADLFRELAKSRLPLSRVDEHHAALSSGDEEAKAVQEVLDATGFYLVKGNNSSFREIVDDEPYPMMAAGAAYWVYRLDKGASLTKTLAVIRAAWAKVSPAEGLRQSMVRGIGTVIHARKGEIDVDRLIATLGKTSPVVIRANAQTEMVTNPKMAAPTAYAIAIVKEYNKGLRKGSHKLSMEGLA